MYACVHSSNNCVVMDNMKVCHRFKSAIIMVYNGLKSMSTTIWSTFL